ncbi:uncharacterized protein C16orf78 homolog [Saccopteryx bilineata]|uniref:uncharacterized protein C16orf78 homolog n=1 Tax=Saccopteryx bilineata TaxID=59482 RepID=UPI00338E8EAC
MAEKTEDGRELPMPTERKSTWRTAEERRLSDLTRVLEWLERRKGKKKKAPQKNTKPVVTLQASGKAEKKAKRTQKQAREKHTVSFSEQTSGPSTWRDMDPIKFRRLYGVEPKSRHLSMGPGSFGKDGGLGKPDLETRDPASQELAQRSLVFHRQGSITDPMFQDAVFAGRKSTILKEWVGKMPEASYERRLKTLLDKNVEPKVDMVKSLKPEEVLSCRYLRLSKNNIRTLLKLCKDAGLNVEIHPHMVEGEIDAKKVFGTSPTVAL